MPKSITVLPERFDHGKSLKIPAIPVYQYDQTLQQEVQHRGKASLVKVLRDMLLVREFENMLGSLRSAGQYESLEYQYRGPAHLSVGQEASAVGMALALATEDHVYGSHRSHGEFIAKGLSAISVTGENELGSIMQAHNDGQLLRTVQQHLGHDGKQQAEDFLLLGFLSEIFMCASGFNRGMGGSMHAFFPPFGAYPNNAIVGGSAGIATGAALYKKCCGSGISVSISGDGSTGCGPVWEAMNFAAMAQFQTLWELEPQGALPVLFLFNNNFYAMGGQTIGETMAWDRLSRIGAGINSAALHAETVDGTNPLAVADAVARQRQRLLLGKGPALLDVECYRYSGHSTSDANAYRSREELKAWQAHDPIENYSEQLVSHGMLTSDEVEAMKSATTARMVAITELAINPDITPPVDIYARPALIGDLMFSNSSTACPPDILSDIPELGKCPRIRQNAKKSRTGWDDSRQPLSPMRAITLRDALFEAILHHMLRDERLVAYGEECREWGGAFGVYRGLADLLPHHRLFNAPISEAAIVASAIGYALEGGRALIELMYADFIGRAGDEIFNQLSKWQSMSGGMLQMPVVLRCSVGSKYGAQHSQDWSSLLTHIPGLKVLYPATPYDAKGLMASALCSNDPVVFFESQRLYDVTECWHDDGVPDHYYTIPLGKPCVKKTGEDVTILTIGPSLFAALTAATELQQKTGLQAEVIDARSLVPFDYDTVLASIDKTGHLLIVSEACERGSFAMTLAANITRFGFASLKKPPRVLGAPNWIVPGAEMESTYFPQASDIIHVITTEFHTEHADMANGIRQWDDRQLSRNGL